jgi:hypothetical protein
MAKILNPIIMDEIKFTVKLLFKNSVLIIKIDHMIATSIL